MNEQLSSQSRGFSTGLLTGIAVAAIIGFFIILGLYLKKDNNSAEDNYVAGEKVEVDNQAPAQPTIEIKVSADDHIRGNPEAKITLVEWSDFQCSYCSRFHQTIQKILEDYPDQVRWVYRHFPLDSIHPYARSAAEASECASEQDKFWEYNDELFAKQSSIQAGGPDFLKQTATDIGLDADKFNECVDSGKYKNKVQQQYQAGAAAGVRGTPGAFLNGQDLGGAAPYEQIKAYIGSLL